MKTKIYIFNLKDFYKAYLSDNDYQCEIIKIQPAPTEGIFITIKFEPLGLFWLGYNFGSQLNIQNYGSE